MPRRRKPLVRPAHSRPKRWQVRLIRLWVMVANAPESGKRGLFASRKYRAGRLFTMLTRFLVGVVVLQESGPHARRVALLRKGWHFHNATPNSYAWGSKQWNAIAYRNDWFALVDRHELDVFGLHLPVVLLEHRKTGWRFVVIGGHAPTKRVPGAFRTRAAIVNAYDAYVARLNGAPVLLGIDANSGGYRVKGLFRVMRHYVDHLLASPHWRVMHRRVVTRPRLSDHRFLLARVRPWWVGTQLNRLPK